MAYEYSGYLSTILLEPDPSRLEKVDSIEFGADDLAAWVTQDLESAIEWQHVPVRKILTSDGVQIEGDFQSVVNIDSLSADDPRYWAPLATIGLTDSRLPVDVSKYPIVEVTYRCTSEHAHPTMMWTYEGGSHFGALPKSRDWNTVARSVQHFGFPNRIDDVVIRLYSPRRTVESLEIKSIRFRAMTSAESKAVKKSIKQIDHQRPPEHYPVLDEFMPLGVYMDAESARRLAEMLGISVSEYWDLVMEDLVEHDHNAIALSHIDQMSSDEVAGLLANCAEHGIRILTRHEYPVGQDAETQGRYVEESIKPTANSDVIFARTFSGEPTESEFLQILEAKRRMEEADPNHPVAIVNRYPNAHPLFSPFCAASGVGHFNSKRPWDAGKTVRTHVPLSDAQQFWLASPAFMYPTQTPPWSTCPEMRLMFNLALANGARGWFAYSYHNDPVWLRGRVQRTLTGPFLTFSDLWSELMRRMKWADALSPLLLQSAIEDEMEDWFVNGISTDSTTQPAPGISPISRFHLRGDDFSLYFTVSNNTRDMASVEIDIPADAVPGKEIHDLSEFVTAKLWRPLERRRHVEMFPGQAHVILVATPERCDEWRQAIAAKMIESDRRKLAFSLDLARAYDLDVSDIEAGMEGVGAGAYNPSDLAVVQSAKDSLTNLIYDTPAIHEARSAIIEASAAVCGCDGGLCRLMGLGKRDLAIEIGKEVIPVAREFTQLRLEVRHGNGAKVAESSRNLAGRALALLERIRREY